MLARNIFFFVAILIPQSAFAYLDIGSSSYLIQILIASCIAGLYTVKTYIKTLWYRLPFIHQKVKSQAKALIDDQDTSDQNN